MKQQTFYGVSDDLVELDGDLIYEEYPCDRAEFVLSSESGTALVEVYYGKGGTWFTAVAPGDDDVPFPDGFAVSITAERYTAKLTVAVPDDTTIKQIRGRDPAGETVA